MKKYLTLLIVLGIFCSTRSVLAFSFYQSVTVDHTLVPNTDQTSFPMLVSGTYANLKTTGNGGFVQNSSGFDVGFYTSNTCSTGKLNWETEKYTATTGEVDYWINIATLSHTTDTVIYMCYGDASITTDQSNPTAVWDTGFKGVYHLSDGTTLSGNDSTSNAHNAVSTHSMPAGAGQVDGAAAPNGASWIDYGNVADYNFGTGDFTVGFWLKTPSASGDGIVTKATAAGTNNGLYISGGTSVVQYYNGSAFINSGAYSSTVFHHFEFQRSGTTLTAYYDGLSFAVGSEARTLSNSTIFNFGIFNNSSGLLPSGAILDETRLSNTARSADWIKTEYNTSFIPDKIASSTQGFYTLGAQTSTGGGGGSVSAFAKMSLFAKMFIGSAKVHI